MNNSTIEIAWPMGAELEIRQTIGDAALVGKVVSIDGPLEQVLGEWVQRVTVEGVQPPFPNEFFLARPIDLKPIAGNLGIDQAEEGFTFDPDYHVWKEVKEGLSTI